jgi:hypothetical protein
MRLEGHLRTSANHGQKYISPAGLLESDRLRDKHIRHRRDLPK